jgi:hypothetical protein
MKAIIDGKRYDTDSAERLGGWQNMSDYGNFALYGARIETVSLQSNAGP